MKKSVKPCIFQVLHEIDKSKSLPPITHESIQPVHPREIVLEVSSLPKQFLLTARENLTTGHPWATNARSIFVDMSSFPVKPLEATAIVILGYTILT